MAKPDHHTFTALLKVVITFPSGKRNVSSIPKTKIDTG